MIDQSNRLDERMAAGRRPFDTPTGLPQSRTTWTERCLLLTAITILPLQDHIPAVGGMSVMFLIFGVLFAYILVNCPRRLGKVWYHPLFLAAYAFIVVSTLLEFSSPLPSYNVIFRFGQMILGAVSVAALCKDRSALAAGLYGFIVAGLWVAVLLYTTSYGSLQEMQAEDFGAASKARSRVFDDKPVQANINGLAFVCVQGAIVAFALCLSERWKHVRLLMVGITVFFLIASFLPMSRGAALMSLASFVAIFYTHGIRYGKALIFACVLGLCIYMLVPEAVWSRMAYSTEVQDGKMEGRARLYTAALNHLPEYFVAGVGSGNYYNKWGFEKGFAKTHDGASVVYGAHNAFLQVTIFWGVIGLTSFLWILWMVYRAIPLQCGRDELAVALVGIIVSLGVQLLQSHTFSDKIFALGIGMLVGARQGIWPAGIVSETQGYLQRSPDSPEKRRA